MDVDEALRQVRQTRQCFLIWRSDTGEPLEVISFDNAPSAEEPFPSLAQLQTGFPGVSVAGRFFDSSKVTHATFEEMAKQASDIRARVSWYDLTAREPLTRVLERLERREYPPEAGDFHGAAHLGRILFGPRRHELMPDMIARLRLLARGEAPQGIKPPSLAEKMRRNLTGERYHGYLEPAARRTLAINLACWDWDVAAIMAMWSQVRKGRMTLGNEIHLIKCFGSLRVMDAGIIADLIRVVEEPGLFEMRHAAMVALGRIGPASGPRAAEVIRAAIYDSSPLVTALRERVCQRLSSPEERWRVCSECDRGQVPGDADHPRSSKSCPKCCGLAWIPVEN